MPKAKIRPKTHRVLPAEMSMDRAAEFLPIEDGL